MAQTKTVSGNNTTYVITDTEGNSVSILLNQSNPGAGRTLTFTSNGGLHVDGQLMVATLMQLLSTGLTP
jgi:hypothetical protein